jgi:hypothetical protein
MRERDALIVVKKVKGATFRRIEPPALYTFPAAHYTSWAVVNR